MALTHFLSDDEVTGSRISHILPRDLAGVLDHGVEAKLLFQHDQVVSLLPFIALLLHVIIPEELKNSTQEVNLKQ